MVERNMPRVQEILLPHLRQEMPGVLFTSWIPNIENRTYPLVNVRRVGGLPVDVAHLDRVVIELTAFHDTHLPDTENLYLDVRQVIYNMVKRQVVTPAGYLHSFFDTMGMTQFDSTFDDTWRVQGMIQLGIRPPRS